MYTKRAIAHLNARFFTAVAALACAACACAEESAPTAAEAALQSALPGIFAKAAAHYKALDAAATPLMHGGKNGAAQYPHGMKRGGLDMRGISGWTCGHYAGDENGHWLLKHGVGAKPMNSEIDTPLNYGDYYFLEALLRFRNSAKK